MFNKRESGHSAAGTSSSETAVTPGVERTSVSSAKGGEAVIGSSIRVDGTLKGDEDLLIQGKVKGTIELKNNSVTIGESGHVTADIYAHTIAVEGRLEGKLVAAERVLIRKTAQIKGMIVAPRVMLEDGARFNGSIDMDPETEALKTAFSNKSTHPKAGHKPAEVNPARQGQGTLAVDKAAGSSS